MRMFFMILFFSCLTCCGDLGRSSIKVSASGWLGFSPVCFSGRDALRFLNTILIRVEAAILQVYKLYSMLLHVSGTGYTVSKMKLKSVTVL